MRTVDWFVVGDPPPCPPPPMTGSGGRSKGARPICDVIPEVPQQEKNVIPRSDASEVAVVRWGFIVCVCVCVCV